MDIAESAFNKFPLFTDLPDEIQTYILSINPNLRIKQSKNNIIMNDKFLNYSLNLPITNEDIIKYLFRHDELTFELFFVTVSNMTQHIYFKIKKEGIFWNMTIKDKINVWFDVINTYNDHEIKRMINHYVDAAYQFYIFDEQFMTEILSERISCMRIDTHYADKYIKHVINSFFDHYRLCPSIIYAYMKFKEHKTV